MLLRDRVYAKYREITKDIHLLSDEGFRKFIQSKRYLKIRKKYLEFKADLIDPLLDRRVNKLLKINYNQEQKNHKKMINADKQHRKHKEKKKSKKPK